MATSIITETTVDMFCIELPKGTKLFKGSDMSTFDTSCHAPLWLTRSKAECKKFGKNVFEFTTNRKLKMVNITSHLFRMHFLDQINIDIAENDDVSLKMKEALLHYNDTRDVHTLSEFIGFHRYSGTNLDIEMISAMKLFYGKYIDGYIQPNEILTCRHKTLCDDVCIFDIGAEADAAPVATKKDGYSQKGGGGGGDPRDDVDMFLAVQAKVLAMGKFGDRNGPLVTLVSVSES